MIVEGYSYCLGDDINTDLIISGRYKFSISDMHELSTHIFEDLDPQFYSRLKQGQSILVGGKNFGMGSSREQASLVVKEAGIVAVVAKSFARIFYRNAINIGLPLVEADTAKIKESDYLRIDLTKGILQNTTRTYEVGILSLPAVMVKLLSDGGLVNHFKKYGRIKL